MCMYGKSELRTYYSMIRLKITRNFKIKYSFLSYFDLDLWVCKDFTYIYKT